jgi:hypothetical protein
MRGAPGLWVFLQFRGMLQTPKVDQVVETLTGKLYGHNIEDKTVEL